MKGTMLLTGGRIYTPTAPAATAMAISNGVITWVGQDEPGRALHQDAEIMPLDGAFVTPAFVDAHVHATATGLVLTGLDLTMCCSLAECLDRIRTSMPRNASEILWGHGWDESCWPERRPPTRSELDAVVGSKAVYLSRIDAHSALVSSALIARVPGIERTTGYSEQVALTRQAHHRVRRVAMDLLDTDQRHKAQLTFLRHAAASGVACVHECAGPDISGAGDLSSLLVLGGRTDVPDIVGYWGELGGTDTARRLGARGAAGDLFVDGALGSRTAALCEPYADAPDTTGELYLDRDQIAEHLVASTHAEMQTGFHVIGDSAVAEVTAGFELAEKVVGTPALTALHHRLEHLEMVTREQAERLAGWGVVASVQPMFDALWGGDTGMYADRLGIERAATLNPFAQLASAGVVLALGSDTPVTKAAPWATVRAAVHHRTKGFGVSASTAFTAHTRGGWWASGSDDSGLAGMLTPGAPAIYAVWDGVEVATAAADAPAHRRLVDSCSVVALPRLDPGIDLPRCIRTVLRGEPIYERPR